MHRRSQFPTTLFSLALLAILGLQLGVAHAQSGWPFVFGPETLTKTDPGQQEFTFTFGATPAPNATYRLILHNSPDNAVTSASVVLNGSEVVTEADFNEMVDRIDVEVDVEASNELTVQLKGDVGSTMRLAIVGRELEDGFLWGGVISSPWVALSEGPGAGIDAVLHVKTLALEGPIAVVIAFFNEAGDLVYRSLPHLYPNHASRGYNVEALLLEDADFSSVTPSDLTEGLFRGSIEIYWVAATPSRAQASYTWFNEGGRHLALGVPFNLIASGRLHCRVCDVTSGEADRQSSNLSSSEIQTMLDGLRNRALGR